MEFAESHIKSDDPSFSRNIDFVFVDRNCKLKVRTKTGNFHGFNSKVEFLTLVSWIAKNEEDLIEYGIVKDKEIGVDEDKEEKVNDNNAIGVHEVTVNELERKPEDDLEKEKEMDNISFIGIFLFLKFLWKCIY